MGFTVCMQGGFSPELQTFQIIRPVEPQGEQEHVPGALRRLLQDFPEVDDQHVPLTAQLGNQRKRPKQVWHFLVGVKQLCTSDYATEKAVYASRF